MILFWTNRILSLAVWLVQVVRWHRNEEPAVAFLDGFMLLVPVALI